MAGSCSPLWPPVDIIMTHWTLAEREIWAGFAAQIWRQVARVEVGHPDIDVAVFFWKIVCRIRVW